MELPPEVSSFLRALSALLPGLTPHLERGGEKLGNWWIDLKGAQPVTIEWRPGRGFGISYGTDAGYGEGPSETFLSPSRAAFRAAQLLAAGPRTRVARLRYLRELYGITQKQMATRLHQQQAAISRLESRDDSRLETISRYVHAMGGQVEVRAVFPDGQMPIFRSIRHPRKAHVAATKSHRPARA